MTDSNQEDATIERLLKNTFEEVRAQGFGQCKLCGKRFYSPCLGEVLRQLGIHGERVHSRLMPPNQEDAPSIASASPPESDDTALVTWLESVPTDVTKIIVGSALPKMTHLAAERIQELREDCENSTNRANKAEQKVQSLLCNTSAKALEWQALSDRAERAEAAVTSLKASNDSLAAEALAANKRAADAEKARAEWQQVSQNIQTEVDKLRKELVAADRLRNIANDRADQWLRDYQTEKTRRQKAEGLNLVMNDVNDEILRVKELLRIERAAREKAAKGWDLAREANTDIANRAATAESERDNLRHLWRRHCICGANWRGNGACPKCHSKAVDGRADAQEDLETLNADCETLAAGKLLVEKDRDKFQEALRECHEAITSRRQKNDGSYLQSFGQAFVEMLEDVLGIKTLTCPDCDGTGFVPLPGRGKITCLSCLGTGHVPRKDSKETVTIIGLGNGPPLPGDVPSCPTCNRPYHPDFKTCPVCEKSTPLLHVWAGHKKGRCLACWYGAVQNSLESGETIHPFILSELNALPYAVETAHANATREDVRG